MTSSEAHSRFIMMTPDRRGRRSSASLQRSGEAEAIARQTTLVCRDLVPQVNARISAFRGAELRIAAGELVGDHDERSSRFMTVGCRGKFHIPFTSQVPHSGCQPPRHRFAKIFGFAPAPFGMVFASDGQGSPDITLEIADQPKDGGKRQHGLRDRSQSGRQWPRFPGWPLPPTMHSLKLCAVGIDRKSARQSWPGSLRSSAA